MDDTVLALFKLFGSVFVFTYILLMGFCFFNLKDMYEMDSLYDFMKMYRVVSLSIIGIFLIILAIYKIFSCNC